MRMDGVLHCILCTDLLQEVLYSVPKLLSIYIPHRRLEKSLFFFWHSEHTEIHRVVGIWLGGLRAPPSSWINMLENDEILCFASDVIIVLEYSMS